MFNPLKALSNFSQMKDQAQKMQSLLKNKEIIVEQQGVKVVMRGDQHIKEVMIDGVLDNRLVEAINEAVKKTQERAARVLMQISQNQS